MEFNQQQGFKAVWTWTLAGARRSVSRVCVMIKWFWSLFVSFVSFSMSELRWVRLSHRFWKISPNNDQLSDASFWDYFAGVNLNLDKVYVYKYEGKVNFGLGKPNRAESGVRITCKLTIKGLSGQTFILQVGWSWEVKCFLNLFRSDAVERCCPPPSMTFCHL